MAKNFEVTANEKKNIERVYMCVVLNNGDVHIKQHTKENKEKINEIRQNNVGCKCFILRGVDTADAFKQLELKGFKLEDLTLIKTRVHAPKEKAVELTGDELEAFFS